MPRIEDTTGGPTTVYVGIDPGASGGIAVLRGHEFAVTALDKMTDRDVWNFLASAAAGRPVVAAIERNTGYVGGGGNTGSSMFAFGESSGFLRGLLVAAGASFERVQPNAWQRALGVPPRGKKGKGRAVESKASFKRRLRQAAEQLFPKVNVTNATADALLIAEYCRRKHTGTL